MNEGSAPRQAPLGLFPGQPAPRLYDRLLEALRTRHYSRRTEQAYTHWIRRFVLFHTGTHPRELDRT
ncbi:MAG: phage integrase N-terminal SAM-like domain-containing protein [Longimicrobiales bacterium]